MFNVNVNFLDLKSVPQQLTNNTNTYSGSMLLSSNEKRVNIRIFNTPYSVDFRYKGLCVKTFSITDVCRGKCCVYGGAEVSFEKNVDMECCGTGTSTSGEDWCCRLLLPPPMLVVVVGATSVGDLSLLVSLM